MKIARWADHPARIIDQEGIPLLPQVNGGELVVYDIKIDFSDPKEVLITSSSSQTGENTSPVEADIKGEGGYIVLNYRYFLDGL